MKKRTFGQTGLSVSELGFGGFHLCEIPLKQAKRLLNRYLDLGGNYVETAPSYGDGESEIKIGDSIAHRRDEFVLVTKSHHRDYEGCKASLNQSLKRLKTDHVDLLLMHAVGTFDELNQILSDNGAIKAAEEARANGQVKHIGISMHGQPDVLIEAINRYPFEAVMTTINYYDDCNFPKIQNTLIPLANEKGIAIILMKALGDGYLYKSVENAFRYALSQSVSVVVAGMNSIEMLNTDLDLFNHYEPMSEKEKLDLLRNAPELGHYVCRQCNACMPCSYGVNITENFRLEGVYDRQMAHGKVQNAAEYALAERLKHWFGTKNQAIEAYASLEGKASACIECGECLSMCPYLVPIIDKLKHIDYKLDPQADKVYE